MNYASLVRVQRLAAESNDSFYFVEEVVMRPHDKTEFGRGPMSETAQIQVGFVGPRMSSRGWRSCEASRPGLERRSLRPVRAVGAAQRARDPRL